MRAKLAAEIPMSRIGTVEDVANMVAMLVSERGRYTTGTVIQVDGGLFRGLR
jgi:3-oxoacyl-[acyl-carrier protein] reductase